MIPNKCFCPLTKEKCREDCAWCQSYVYWNDDGMNKQWHCAVCLIAGGNDDD